jgi:hypothetical protein
VKSGWFLPVFIRDEDKLAWWSGPIRSGGRGSGSGSQVSGGGVVCKSLRFLGDIKLLKMEPTQCSETSDFNTQTPGKYPEDNSSLLQHGESLKSRRNNLSQAFQYDG